MNGLLLRTEVDKVTGQLSDTRTRFLGTRAPKLFAVPVRGRRSMLALSSRPWLVRPIALCSQHPLLHMLPAGSMPAPVPLSSIIRLCMGVQGYSEMGRYTLSPLSYEALDYASGFASDQCPEGFCAVSRNTLRILTLERLGEAFNQQACAAPLRLPCKQWKKEDDTTGRAATLPSSRSLCQSSRYGVAQVTRLRYTPRKFVVHPETNMLIVAEADHAAVPLAERSNASGMDAEGNGALPQVCFQQQLRLVPPRYGTPDLLVLMSNNTTCRA